VSTTKGTGGDIIILEEAAYVASGVAYNPTPNVAFWCNARRKRSETRCMAWDLLKHTSAGFFYETVAPLLCIGNTSFIAISTLTSEMNFYTVGRLCASSTILSFSRRFSRNVVT